MPGFRRIIHPGLDMAMMNQGGFQYLLRDDFTGNVAAGSINNTYSTDGKWLRTVVDAENKLSIVNDFLTFAGGKAVPAYGNPGLWYPAFSRKAGQILMVQMSTNRTDKIDPKMGWSPNQSGNIVGPGPYSHFTTASTIQFDAANPVDTYDISDLYKWAIVQRAAGAFYFIQGGAKFPYWTLLGSNDYDTSASLYPAIITYNGAGAVKTIRILTLLWLPAPLISDSFARTDGAPGNTDGLGHQEHNGGGGLAWADKLGASAIATNKFTFASLTGGVGLSVVTATSPNVEATLKTTRAAGIAGIVFRWVDANNYAYAYLLNDGANKLAVHQVIGGSDSEVLAPTAVTYSATRRGIRARCYGNSVRMFYDTAAEGWQSSNIGGVLTLNAALANGMGFGAYTTDTGNSFGNFLVYALGMEGQYQ